MAENLAVDLGKRASDSSAIAMQWGVQRGKGEGKEENEGSADDRRATKHKIILEYLCHFWNVWFKCTDIRNSFKISSRQKSSTFAHIYLKEIIVNYQAIWFLLSANH